MSVKATKKPVEVEVIQWTGDNLKEVLEFTGKHPKFDKWFPSFEDYEVFVKSKGNVFKVFQNDSYFLVEVGSFILKRSQKSFKVLTERPFNSTYNIEPVKGIDKLTEENARLREVLTELMQLANHPLTVDALDITQSSEMDRAKKLLKGGE